MYINELTIVEYITESDCKTISTIAFKQTDSHML